MNALRLLLPISLLVSGVCSAATIIATAPTPSGTDLFNNAAIISSSPLISGSDARDTFGGSFSSVEPTHTLFADGSPAGTAFQVTFDLGAPKVIGGYDLYVADDSSPLAVVDYRSIVRFQLLQGATILSDVAVLNMGQNNTTVYGGNSLKISDTFSAVSGQQFTAVFYSNNAANFSGPRVIELDAVAGVVPEPGTLGLLALGGLAMFAARRRKA